MAVVERSGQHRSHNIPGASFEFLAEDEKFDVHMITLEPGVAGALSQHDGKEALYVVEGDVNVDVEGSTYRLSKGDSLIYQSTNPHRWSNPGISPAKALVVAVPKSMIAKALGL